MSIRQINRLIILIQRQLGDTANQPRLCTVRIWQRLSQLVDLMLTNRTIVVLRVLRVTLRRLQRWQASLHGTRKHRVRGNAKKSVVLQPKVDEQIIPSFRVEHVLIWLKLRAHWKGQQCHAFFDLLKLILLEGWKEFLCMFNSRHTLLALDELDEFLLSDLELNVGVDLTQFTLIIDAPCDAFWCVVIAEIFFDFTNHLEDVYIGDLANATAIGQHLSAAIVAESEKVLDDESVESNLFPLVFSSDWNLLLLVDRLLDVLEEVGRRWRFAVQLEMIESTFADLSSS